MIRKSYAALRKLATSLPNPDPNPDPNSNISGQVEVESESESEKNGSDPHHWYLCIVTDRYRIPYDKRRSRPRHLTKVYIVHILEDRYRTQIAPSSHGHCCGSAFVYCGSGSRQKCQRGIGSGSMNLAIYGEQNTSIRDLSVIILK